MNTNQLAKDNSVALIVGVVILGGVGYAIYRIIDKLKNPNAGTPYEGTGVIGTAGNAVNTALGGAPEAVGGAIGRALYDWTHSGGDDAEDVFYTFDIEGASIYSELLKTNVQRGSIRSDLVDGKGYFVYYGVRLRMRQDQQGKRFAVRA